MKNTRSNAMKYICCLLLLLLPCFVLRAQQDDNKYAQIRALKVTYLSERLKLSKDQDTRFWPVYSRYETERRNVRKTFYQKYQQSHANAAQNQEKARQYVDDNIEYQEQELALKKKYKDELLKIITPQQLAELYQAERDFRKMLVEKLRTNK